MIILRTLLKFILGLALIILLIWLIALGVLHTETGQKWALKQTVHYFERQTQTRIRADDIDFVFPLGLRIQGLSLTDSGEELLTIQQLDVSCAYWLLLEGRFVCPTLHAKGIHVIKLPSNEQTSEQRASTKPLKMLENALIPFYVKFENILFRDIQLSPTVIEKLNLPAQLAEKANQSLFSLKGSASNNPFKNTISSQFFIRITDKTEQTPPILFGLDLYDRQLALSAHYNHLSYPIKIGEESTVIDATMALFAAASLSSWQDVLENGIHDDNSIEGQFKITANLSDIPSPIVTLLGNEVILKGKYAWKAHNRFHLWNTQLKSHGLNLKGSAIIDSDYTIQNGVFDGDLHNLSYLSPFVQKDLEGPLVLQGEVSGPLMTPTMTLQGSSPAVTIQSHVFKNIRSTIIAAFQGGHLEGLLNLSLNYKDHPCHLLTAFKSSRESTHFSDLEFNALHSRIQGSLQFNSNDSILEGYLEAYSRNFNELTTFFPFPIYGEGEVKIHLKPTYDQAGLRRQAGICDLSGYALRWNDLHVEQLAGQVVIDPTDKGKEIYHLTTKIDAQNVRWVDKQIASLSLTAAHEADLIHYTLNDVSANFFTKEIKWPQGKAQEATVDLYLANPLKDLQGEVTFAVKQVKTPSAVFDYFQGKTTILPSDKQWPFHLQGQGRWKEQWAAQIEGFWSFEKDSYELILNHLDGSFGPYPLTLLKTLTLIQQPDKIQLSDLFVRWGEAELAAEFSMEKQTVSFHFNTNEISTDILQAISPDLPLTGKASLNGYLEGPIQQPTGELKVHLHNMQITEDIFAQKPLIQGEIDLNIHESGIQLQSTLNGIGHSPVIAYGTLPFTPSLSPPGLNISQITPFSLNLEAEGKIDPYMHLLYNDSTNLTGDVKIALNLSGQINTPRIQGSIDLYNGAYESLSSGSTFHNIQAHLEGDGSKIVLKNFSAENTKSGSITASGVIDVDKNKDFPFDLQIHPSQLFIMESDYANISASGPLKLIGTRKKAKLQGNLTVDTAVIDMDGALPKQIKSVEVKYINLKEGEELPQYLETPSPLSTIEFDIKLQFPGKVLIEGKHLTSEWKGAVAITGTPTDPLLNGDLRVMRGEYNFNGKVFNLTQGSIHFAGSPGKKTSIYVVASKEIDRIKADIIVKGPTNKLVVSFRSNPPLSQREILSYILFNRGIADITPDQGDQLSQSFISLNESEQTSSSDDFLTRIRNNIGIDRLDITSNDSENKDLALQVGKYITEGVFVSINKSISDIGNRLAIEAKIHKNLKAQAEVEVGGDAQGKVSLKWKKDY